MEFGSNWASDGGSDLADCIAQLSTSKWTIRGARSVTHRSGEYMGLKGDRCWFYSSDTLADAVECLGGASYTSSGSLAMHMANDPESGPASATVTCPRDGTTDVRAADPPDSLTITKTGPVQNYVDFGLCLKGETCRLDFNYDKLINGDQFCSQTGGDEIEISSTVYFRTNNACRTPPVNKNGAACCEVKVWQPAANGLYYDDCSMTLDVGSSGELAWTTDMPGDEAAAFAAASDNLPHIHYQINCSGCQKDSFYSSNGDTWGLEHDASKIWLGKVCYGCGSPSPTDAHGALEIEAGKWVYEMVIDF